MIRFISVTPKTNPESVLINRSFNLLKKLNPDGMEFEVVTNNTEALSVVYNRFLRLSKAEDYIVFIHDDVMIEDLCIFEKLESACEKFGIVGIAGISGPLAIKPPVLWHLVGPAQNRRGEVSNFLATPEELKSDYFSLSDVYSVPRITTSFGPTFSQATFIDGVFMGVHVGTLRQHGVLFDEKNPARFHFYDLNLCIDAVNRGVIVGVAPIRIVHCSPGLTHPSTDWYNGQEYIIKKINEYNKPTN